MKSRDFIGRADFHKSNYLSTNDAFYTESNSALVTLAPQCVLQLRHSTPVKDVVTYPCRENLIQTRFSWTYGSFDIFHPGLVISQRPSPDISQYIPSFSRYCMEMLGRDLSRRVSLAKPICSRLQRMNGIEIEIPTIIRESAIVPIFRSLNGSTSMSAVCRARLKALVFGSYLFYASVLFYLYLSLFDEENIYSLLKKA